MNTYIVNYYGGNGVPLFSISDFTYLRYTRSANNVGTLTIQFVSPPRNLLYGDYILVYRNNINDSRTLWFINKIHYDIINRIYTLECVDANYLLSTRIIAYSSGTPETNKTDYPDNMIYEIIDENFNKPTDSNRELLLSVGSGNNIGTTIQKSFARNNVLTTLQSICRESSLTNRLYFDTTYTGNKLIFRVYENSIGAFRNLVLGISYGNVEELEVTEDYTDLCTLAYVGGRDTGINRQIAEVERTIRNTGPYSRIEQFREARQYNTIDGLETEASSFLYETRAKTIIKTRLKDTDQARYGTDWSFGDRVKIEVLDQIYEANIDAVQIRIDDNTEDIDAYLSVVL